MEILNKTSNPVTVDYIFEELKKVNKTVSISTVYRIMEKLTLNNIVEKSMIMDGSKANYELVNDSHKHYIICVKCNKMTPIDACPLEEMEKHICEKTGFSVTGHKLELYGICSSCSK